MATNIFASAEWLRIQSNLGYGPMPIPQLRDIEISDLLRVWLSYEERRRKAALSHVAEDYRFTLIAYSERMASLAVRNCDGELILLGLLANGLGGWRYDWRDNATVLCLHYDAAQRVGLCPSHPFEAAAKVLPDKAADALRSFLVRSKEDRSLDAMGYVVSADAEGFRYARKW